MSFNVSRFKSNLNEYGYAKNNRFEVFVQPPKFLQNKVLVTKDRQISINNINNMMRYRIEQVKSPSVSLLSIDTSRYAIGPTQKMPYNAQFFDITFSVLVDKNTDLWDFWYNWINAIFNFNGQEPGGNNLFTGTRIPNYITEYKDEYSTMMMIVIYGESGETIKTINLYEAFPSSMREVQLAWNDNVDLMRLALTITYSGYSIVGSNINTASPAVGATTQ